MVANFPQLIVLWSELYRAVHPPVQVMLDPTRVSLTFYQLKSKYREGIDRKIKEWVTPSSYLSKRGYFYFI